MTGDKLISIITVCYNAQEFIEKTLLSVLDQTYRPLQHIIIDGASTDSTLEIIEKYKPDFIEKNIDLQVVSEPDKGIYDAMNKGVTYAGGEWINFLNSGDIYYDNEIIKNIFDNDLCGIDFVYGDSKYIVCGIEKKGQPGEPDISNIFKICHQSIFVKTEAQKRFSFDLSYKIAADRNSMVKMFLSGLKFKYLPVLVVDYDMTGVSSTNNILAQKEHYRVKRENGLGGNRFKEWIIISKIRWNNLLKKILPKSIVYKIQIKNAKRGSEK